MESNKYLCLLNKSYQIGTKNEVLYEVTYINLKLICFQLCIPPLLLLLLFKNYITQLLMI